MHYYLYLIMRDINRLKTLKLNREKTLFFRPDEAVFRGRQGRNYWSVWIWRAYNVNNKISWSKIFAICFFVSVVEKSQKMKFRE